MSQMASNDSSLTEKFPIRIAQIIGKAVGGGGGVEAVVLNYYRHIDKSRVQFDFIIDEDSVFPQEEEIVSLGGKVYRVAPYQHIFQNMKDMRQLFCQNKYQIVHVHLNTMSVFALRVAKRCGVPVRICHNHSTAGKGETKKNLMKYCLRPLGKVYPTHLFACSHFAGEWMFGKKSMAAGEVTVINNAIDVDKFAYRPDVRQQVRDELDLQGKFVIGHAGRFNYQKNHEFLLDIFSEIHKKREDSVLLLAGSGPLETAMKEKAQRLGLAEHVRFLGVRRDIDRLYQAMDVFVFPSLYEGLGVVLVEAQASGLPCFAAQKTVPQEAKLTDLLSFIPLSISPQEWADQILAQRVDSERIDRSDEIRQKGFDIRVEAEKLRKWYENVAKK